MLKSLSIIAVVLLLVIILVSLFRRSVVNYFAFYPEPGTAVDLSRLPEPVEHLYLDCSDQVTISAFYLPREGARKTFLFFHGNAGNASHRLPHALGLWNLDANVLLVDYRGYGLSKGSPSENGIYLDGLAALSFLVAEKRIPQEDIILFGRSLGATVAVYLAESHQFAGMILVSPFSSGKDVAKATGLGFLAPFIGDPFNSLQRIGQVECPTLVMHGKKDMVIPHRLGQRLSEYSPSLVRFISIEGAGHNDIIQNDPQRFYRHISDFCEGLGLDRSEP